MNYWHMQLHPDKPEWNKEKQLLQEYRLIGLGDWEENKNQQVSFEKVMDIGDVVLIKRGGTIIALVEVIGKYEYEDRDDRHDGLDWFPRRRRIKILDWYDETYNFHVTPRGTLTRCNENNEDAETNITIRKWHERVFTMNWTSETLNILKTKKQIILQGAPGSGKTYQTATLAVRLIHPEMSFPDRTSIKRQYDEDLKAGRIGFATFHQSLDYEQFVEGYKPLVTSNGQPGFVLQDGLFKKMCDNARGAPAAASFQAKYQQFIQFLSEQDVPFELKTSKQGKPFSVSLNSAGTIVATPKTEKATEMSITRTIIQEYRDKEKAPYWDSYTGPIVDYINENFDGKIIATETQPATCVLIIDEINRGNISKIFGELITLIEADKREDLTDGTRNSATIEVKLTYSQEGFTVPANLYIIGTMNTADRSVGQIDYALRRRFAFVTCKASRKDLEEFAWDSSESEKLALEMFDAVSEFLIQPGMVSPDFDAEDLMVGHSYFMATNQEELGIKFRHEVMPLLLEYQKDGILNYDRKKLLEKFEKWNKA